MSLLYRVIYATHANGTHHKLALDALNRLTTERAEDWRRVFLKHAELYMQGSKAPDKEFKDFKNHVLHPGDNYWGGAPDKARGWYTHLVTALKEENWSEAVWCAGVLSHYYTDPIHPFHTAQSEAESAIHRAVEWSINRSYNDLYKLGCASSGPVDIQLPDGDTWLEDLVCGGADRSHRHYERLIAHYDINVGASNPEEGLDQVGRAVIGELLIYATTGFARILDRAVAEAAVEPPKVDLSVATFLATLKIPLKWVLRKLDDAADQAAVEAMYDELMNTGRVDKTLSDDDRMIRDLHTKEVREPQMKARANARRARFDKTTVTKEKPALSTLITRDPAIVPKPTTPPAQTNIEPIVTTRAAITTNELHSVTFKNDAPDRDSEKRIFLAADDDLEQAPAIGPKTAARLAAAGLFKIKDLLNADPDEIAEQISQRHITATVVRNWQDCARLVMEIPELRGTNAQLMAGAGFNTSQSIAEADPAELSAAILRFAATKEGERILRDGTPPDIEKIKSWVENASLARAA